MRSFTVRRDAGENQIWLNKRQAADTPQTITAALGDADTVWLRVKFDDQRYVFSYSTNGTSWTVLDSAPSLSVIDFPGFAGVFNGIWATSGVTGVSTDTPAYFDWAEYLPYALDADAPVIVAATNPVPAGGVLTVTGTGFAPEESVAVSLVTDPAVTTPVDTTVDGTFTVDVTVPAGIADGDYVVNALGAVSLVASTTTVTVQTPVATTVTLSSSATAPAVDTAFDLTADVDPTAAAGVVEFLDGGTLAGSVAVADGTATLTTTAAVAGEHRYTARFVPADAAVFDPSVSNTVVVTVAGVPVTSPALTLSSDKVRAGGAVTITGTGYPVGEGVTIELHSAPVVLGSATVDAEGGFTVTITIPAATTTGAHRIIATATPSGARAEAALSVTGAASSGNGNGTDRSRSLASTGATGTGPMATGVIVLLLVGAGLLLAMRHRRESGSTSA
jgi:hypothetical protein